MLRPPAQACLFASLVAAMTCLGGEPSKRTPSRPTRTRPDHSYSTALQWEPKMELATKKARRQRKLLLVLAVAGHFEDPGFT